MDVMRSFLRYTGDFEQTLADDDWTRLRQYFTDTAVYEVYAPFGCRLIGPAAIFAGIKKSLDGFDRKFSGRETSITSGPEISDAEIRIGWKVVYRRDGWPPFTLLGRSVVRYAGDRIVYLADAYEPGLYDAFDAWQRETGTTLDPSYI